MGDHHHVHLSPVLFLSLIFNIENYHGRDTVICEILAVGHSQKKRMYRVIETLERLVIK